MFRIAAATVLCTFLTHASGARESSRIIVDAKGNGDFRSIQEAINSIPADNKHTVMVLIRNGVYNEKLYIQRSYITLVGEDKDSTRVVYAELRENWNKEHNGSDWGSAVVNIDTFVTDITLANLTMYNNYGWQNNVFNKHQFTIRGGGTRIVLLHCVVKSDGGDALSLWNKHNGMYYHADCTFEGWVDYVCPRGWCYITNSRFFGHNMSASIWHDGDADKKQKFVIRDSYFDGVPGFPLGRNHRDGQMYLIDCRFSERMANRPIYHPETSQTQWRWGARHYYYNCRREGGDFDWFRNNLDSAEGAPTADQITALWTFDGKWDPEATMSPVLPFAFHPYPRDNAKNVRTDNLVLTWIPGRDAEAQTMYFGTVNPPQRKKNAKEARFEALKLKPRTTYYWRVDAVTDKGVVPGNQWSFTTGK